MYNLIILFSDRDLRIQVPLLVRDPDPVPVRPGRLPAPHHCLLHQGLDHAAAGYLTAMRPPGYILLVTNSISISTILFCLFLICDASFFC